MSTTSKIESHDLTVEKVFSDFYTVPNYQREFVWQPENVEKLLEEVYRELYDSESDDSDGKESTHEYFIGSIVVCPYGDGTFELIDGQQRLTTIFLLLCSIRDSLQRLKANPPDTLKRYINNTSMDPETGDDVNRFRIVLQYEDSRHVLEMIGTSIRMEAIPQETASTKNILAAYETIDGFIAEKFAGDPTKIKRFLATVTSRVKLIRIETPNRAYALKIFETINDRGVGLTPMDLLKNLLFIEVKPDSQEQLKGSWRELIDTLNECKEKPLRFLRYYIFANFAVKEPRSLPEDKTYEWLASNSEEVGIKNAPLRFMGNLLDSSHAYRNFVFGKNIDNTPNHYLSNISTFSRSARQHFILLMAALHLSPTNFDVLCRLLEKLFFCYVITGTRSNVYERNFTFWASKLREVHDDESFREFIDAHILTELVNLRNDFEYRFRSLSLSTIQGYRMRYILAKLTQYVEERAWGNPADADLSKFITRSVHVEHILPTSPPASVRSGFDRPDEYDDYANRLGNLTLLEKTINASISNGSYEQKKAGYAQSNFLLTKSLVEKPHVGVKTQLNKAVEDLMQFEKLDSEDIEKRQEMLTTLALRIWLGDVQK